MSSLFKKFKKKLPSISTKGSTYYERENSIEGLTDLKNTLEAASKLKTHKSEIDFTFNGMPLAKISQQLIKSKFGSPSYTLNNGGEIEGHKVMFYKESVQHYKFLIQYHFINNDFFFASNKVSSLTVLSDEDKQKVINRISNKYLSLTFANADSLTIKLVDPNNSIIYTRDDVYFHINYLAGNQTTKLLIEKYADSIVNPENPKGFNESLDQYI